MPSRNARLAMSLFFIYLILYAGFVLLNAISPDTMDYQPVDGINLAIIYGFTLILTAFVLALIYGVFCRNDAPRAVKREGKQ